MSEKDIRWIQRFANYCKAFDQIDISIMSDIDNEKLVNHIERVGVDFYEQ